MLVSAVRSALADAVRAGVVSTPPLTVLAYVPDSIVPPVLYVQPEEITFDRTFGRGHDEMTFTLRLLVSRADDRASQGLLDAYLNGTGAASVKAALHASRGTPNVAALGGTADSCHVTGVRSYQWFAYGSERFLGADFSVIVRGSGT